MADGTTAVLIEGLVAEVGHEAGTGLIERLHNLIAICREDKIAYINQTGAQMLGFSHAAEVIGRPIAGFFHEDYQQFVALGLELFVEEQGVISTKFVRPDGVAVDVEVWVSRLEGEGSYFLVEARDVSAHLRAARALHEREKRLEGILNTVADGIITVNDQGVIESYNPAAEKIFGFSTAEVLGKSIRTLIPVPYSGRLDGHAPEEVACDWLRNIKTEVEVEGHRKDGNTVPVEMAVREMRHGDNVSFTSIVRDITKRKEAERLIQQMAHYDSLTGLPNRYLLGDRLEKAIRRAQRHREFMALMFVDLDRFKPINDELGHAAGDLVLKEIALRLSAHVRASDTVARVGGDEFVILVEDLLDAKAAELVALKILEALDEPIQLGEQRRTVGASIGIALCPRDGLELSKLTHCADVAMYAAKKAGRGCYRFFQQGLDEPPPRE
jgi:diguanylate cyclase (GGDEF)-like protein/PAS domain S-box-containing protein